MGGNIIFPLKFSENIETRKVVKRGAMAVQGASTFGEGGRRRRKRIEKVKMEIIKIGINRMEMWLEIMMEMVTRRL